MDECSLWEIDVILDNLPYIDRNIWESQRLVSYTIAKANFKNIGKIDEYIPFPWEKNKPKEKSDTSISNEDIQRLKTLAKTFEKHEK